MQKQPLKGGGMSVIYNLSAIDILNIFDDIPKMWETVSKELSMFEEEYQINLPDMFKKFMESASNILETADIWTQKPEFFYDEIEITISEILKDGEMIEEDSEYYTFWKASREHWNDLIDDYLEIGSDYGAGISCFGIRKQDLNQENPPVYYRYETDSLFDEWKLLSKHLSDYFLTVVCDALAGADYDTAQEILQKYHWKYAVYETDSEIETILSEYEIDSAHLLHLFSFHAITDKEWLSCCYDKNRNVFFLFWNTRQQKKIITVSK